MYFYLGFRNVFTTITIIKKETIHYGNELKKIKEHQKTKYQERQRKRNNYSKDIENITVSRQNVYKNWLDCIME